MCVYPLIIFFFFFFFSSRRRHTRFDCDWSSDVCSSDLLAYRRGSTALRLRVYHQSSHLGDEYMLHARAQRVDLSFEAAELRSEEHTSELQSQSNLVCRLLLEKKKKRKHKIDIKQANTYA